jgi:hypothetical protein
VLLQAPPGAFRNEDAAREFLKGFRESHQSDKGGESIGMLREGVTANMVQTSNEAAQFIEQRQFQRQEAALWFLLESILGDDTSQSYNTLEQKVLAYLSNCLGRWLRRIEEEFDKKLLTQSEQLVYYFKVNTGALLRTDLASTMAALSSAITSRIINPNEAREKLDMNPYDGGDQYANPSITPGSSGADTQAKALTTRLERMLGIEANRVAAGAKAKDFLKWVEEFYAKWQGVLESVLREMDSDATVAADHCESQKNALIELSGTANRADFPGKVADFVSNWKEKAPFLAEKAREIYV